MSASQFNLQILAPPLRWKLATEFSALPRRFSLTRYLYSDEGRDSSDKRVRVSSFQRVVHVCNGVGTGRCVHIREVGIPHFRGWYVQASGPEDVSLLERYPHFRGWYVLSQTYQAQRDDSGPFSAAANGPSLSTAQFLVASAIYQGVHIQLHQEYMLGTSAYASELQYTVWWIHTCTYKPAVLEWDSWHQERTASTHSYPLQHEEEVPHAHDWLEIETEHTQYNITNTLFG